MLWQLCLTYTCRCSACSREDVYLCKDSRVSWVRIQHTGGGTLFVAEKALSGERSVAAFLYLHTCCDSWSMCACEMGLCRCVMKTRGCTVVFNRCLCKRGSNYYYVSFKALGQTNNKNILCAYTNKYF